MQMLDEGTTSRDSLHDRRRAGGAWRELGAGGLDVDGFTVRAQATSSIRRSRSIPTSCCTPPSRRADLDRVKQNSFWRRSSRSRCSRSMGLRVLPRAALRHRPRLRSSADRQRHRGVGARDHPRRPGPLPPRWFQPNHATLSPLATSRLAELTPKLERPLRGGSRGDCRRRMSAARAPPRTTARLPARPSGRRPVLRPRGSAAPPPTAHGDELLRRSFNDAFGGDFMSRINMNLREDKHWSYGVSSGLSAEPAVLGC